MIASIADEADRLIQHLPNNRGHLCLDTAELPSLLKKIFMANILH